MFTGLVETMAPVIEILDQPPGKRLTLQADAFFEDAGDAVQLGDSIAINGCCLTVVAIEGTKLAFEAGEETLSRTNLGRLVAGQSAVNLERSLPVGGRMGGHYVTGHIDTVGHLVERIDDPPWAFLRFELPEHYAVQVVGKGSIAIDGVSLTVVDIESNAFRVALIPHTLAVTTLGKLTEGDPVNLETDLLAKYVGRYLGQETHVQPDGDVAPWNEAVTEAFANKQGPARD
ncbi:MAG: riboflavin synthase [Planctomycetota bacterium]